SPRSWPGAARDVELDELVLHELTHCVLFQSAGTGDAWKTKHIPFWFREGMATVSANQGPLYPSLEDLARWQAAHPEADVFTDGDALAADDYDHVYGQAHHALTFLQSRYGGDVVNGILAALPTAPDFDTAFVTHVGLSVESFAREFRTYLKLRGFRGWGRPLHPSTPAPDRRF
ncbi:MAG: hypothetical protein JNG84_11825, partial [Archangium sp.]|nr:hypothetical protein [Archangium sp.]